MSQWTHITACMSVETEIIAKKPELKRRLNELLKKAPKITGSEEPADVFVNIQSGYSWHMSRDCEHCKYKDTIREFQDEDGDDVFECDGPDNYDCSAEYQTHVVISVQGDLRDRIKEETEKEFEAFKDYINDKVGYIRDYAINIKGE